MKTEKRNARLGNFFLVLTLVFFTVAWFAPAAHGQPTSPLTISTGGLLGSYHKFMLQVKEVCTEVPLSLVEAKNGTLDTVDRMDSNDASGGPVQPDVLAWYGKARDMSNFKVLMPLFYEQVHFVALNTQVPKAPVVQAEKSWLGKAKDKVGMGDSAPPPAQASATMATVSDIAGKRVAASGGSFMTGKLFKLLSEIPYTLVEVPGGADAALAKVLNGEADVAILVGAAPLGTITSLPDDVQASLKLLPMPAELAAKLGAYKLGQTITYRKMGDTGTNITALSIPASLVVQNYKQGTEKSKQVLALRDCILAKADTVSQTPGKHPAWRDVAQGKVKSSWDVYGADWTVKPVVQTTAAPGKKK